MLLLVSSGSILIVLYGFLALSFRRGWKKIPVYLPGKPVPGTKISVVVALRNESQNVSRLLDDLACQDLDPLLFEVIMVDDHSVDQTVEIIRQQTAHLPGYKLLRLDREGGKKAALYRGVQEASGKLIATTDGDCRLPVNWLSSILSFYQDDKFDLLTGPVLYQGGSGFFRRFLEFEFLALVVSGAGSAGSGNPILCNGANLAFPKDVYLRAFGHTIPREASGDDIFLLLRLKKDKGNIRFMKSRANTVITRPPDTLSDFIHQRLRWTLKSRHYRDTLILATAALVWLTSLLMLLAALLTVFSVKYLAVFFILYSAKCIIDYTYLRPAFVFFQKKNLLRYLPFFQFFYFIYVVVIPLLSLILPYRWKGRSAGKGGRGPDDK